MPDDYGSFKSFSSVSESTGSGSGPSSYVTSGSGSYDSNGSGGSYNPSTNSYDPSYNPSYTPPSYNGSDGSGSNGSESSSSGPCTPRSCCGCGNCCFSTDAKATATISFTPTCSSGTPFCGGNVNVTTSFPVCNNNSGYFEQTVSCGTLPGWGANEEMKVAGQVYYDCGQNGWTANLWFTYCYDITYDWGEGPYTERWCDTMGFVEIPSSDGSEGSCSWTAVSNEDRYAGGCTGGGGSVDAILYNYFSGGVSVGTLAWNVSVQGNHCCNCTNGCFYQDEATDGGTCPEGSDCCRNCYEAEMTITTYSQYDCEGNYVTDDPTTNPVSTDTYTVIICSDNNGVTYGGSCYSECGVGFELYNDQAGVGQCYHFSFRFGGNWTQIDSPYKCDCDPVGSYPGFGPTNDGYGTIISASGLEIRDYKQCNGCPTNCDSCPGTVSVDFMGETFTLTRNGCYYTNMPAYPEEGFPDEAAYNAWLESVPEWQISVGCSTSTGFGYGRKWTVYAEDQYHGNGYDPDTGMPIYGFAQAINIDGCPPDGGWLDCGPEPISVS
jgi:hypothetical protein